MSSLFSVPCLFSSLIGFSGDGADERLARERELKAGVDTAVDSEELDSGC